MVASIEQLLDDWCEGMPKESEKAQTRYGFILRVIVFPNIAPRDPMFTYLREFGVSKLDDLFAGTLTRMTPKWFIAFPEAHCSVGEQYQIVSQMVSLNKKYNWGLKELTILTQCPAIISDCLSDFVSIMR